MAGDRYLIRNQNDIYFITCTVVYWIDLFTRREFKKIIVDALNYCVENKGLNIFSWVLMSNHIHLIGQVQKPHGMSEFLRDFKKFTSKKIIKEMERIPESRRDWMKRNLHLKQKEVEELKTSKYGRIVIMLFGCMISIFGHELIIFTTSL